MASRPDILMRVGATFDRSFDAVLADAEKKMARAFGTGRGARQGANEALAVSRDAARQQLAIAKAHAANEVTIARDVYRENSRLNRQLLTEQSRAQRQQAAQAAQLSRQRTQERLRAIHEEERMELAHSRRVVQMAQQAEREKNRIVRNEGRQRYREQLARDREIDRFATRTSHRATRFFFPPPEGALGYMKRTALDVARGAGVDFTLGGGVQRARERESAGMGLAQQERIATGGQTRGGAFWAGKSLEVGTELAVAPEQVTAMMRAFTGKTGDFDAAAEQAKALASITLASGANMDEMGSAAGYVYNQLKGMPDAAARTLDVMRGIVGQTAVGAVEMEEYAKQMGRIAANAKMFQGDVSKNILELSALTQLSIAEGGATSGADAARSIAAFANTTSKGIRINAFKKHGVELFNETGTQKRPILDIIKDSLIASKGNIPAMTQMWADTLGQKPIRGLTNAFNAAGGGEAGWKAALEQIRPFMGAQLDKDTERKNIEDYSRTTAARAQRFQNQLDRITDSMANRLLPTLEKLAPTMLSFTEKLSGLVNWAAENPGKAILAAITASIARAGLESVGRLIVDRVMVSLGGTLLHPGVSLGPGMVGGPGGVVSTGVNLGGVGGVATGVAATAGILAAAYAGFTITTALLDIANAEINKEEGGTVKSANQVYQEFASEYGNATTDEERAAAWKRGKYNLDQVQGNRGAWDLLFGDSDVMGRTLGAMTEIAGRHDKAREKREDRELVSGATGQTPAYNTEIAAMVARELIGALGGVDLNVRVRNVGEFNFEMDNGGQHMGGPLRSDWVSQ